MHPPGSERPLAERLTQCLTTNWQKIGPVAGILLPLVWLYQALVTLRRWLYRTGVYESHKVPIPVIVVGNVISGGAGKTPTTIAIVRHLQARGLSVGVVSRGYGRKARSCLQVQPTSAPEEVGDEPLLIRQATGAAVFVGANRYEAALGLIRQVPEPDVIISDDGLQHYGLYRDIEVCVFDNRGCGNGLLLPAGPLRETWPRQFLATAGQSAAATLVLHTGDQPAFEGFKASRALAADAIAKDGTQVSLAVATSDPEKPPFAIAGISQPQAFFDMLKALDIPLIGTRALPDHAAFKDLDLPPGKNWTLLCTEKDAAKLWRLAPQALAVPLVQTMEPAFFSALDRLLEPHLRGKLSSGHG